MRFLAITLSEFSVPSGQLSLQHPMLATSDVGHHQKEVSEAIDAIRDRYGLDSIVLGSMFQSEDHAPERIGFRKTDML